MAKIRTCSPPRQGCRARRGVCDLFVNEALLTASKRRQNHCLVGMGILLTIHDIVISVEEMVFNGQGVTADPCVEM